MKSYIKLTITKALKKIRGLHFSKDEEEYEAEKIELKKNGKSEALISINILIINILSIQK